MPVQGFNIGDSVCECPSEKIAEVLKSYSETDRMKNGPIYELGRFRLDVGQDTLFREGQPVPVPPKDLGVLIVLVENSGRLVTKEELFAKVWPNSVVEEGNLARHIFNLRQLLGDGVNDTRHIETIPKRGYRLVTPVTQVDNNGPASASTPTAERSHRHGRIGAALATAIVVLGAGILWVFVWPQGTHESQEPMAANAEKSVTTASTAAIAKPGINRLRLAILPFENLSPDPANAFFTDGMHEEVLSTLASRATTMDVMSRTTMMSYKDRPTTITEIANALRVTHVLEGSVRREGQTVRLKLRLIDARNDGQLWSQSYDRKLVNAMTLQTQVASEVATQLAVRLLAKGDELPPSTNPEAFDLYLKARLAIQSLPMGAAPPELIKVEAWLTRAITLDKLFAAAYAERARTRMMKFAFNHDVSQANLQALREDLATVRSLAGATLSILSTEGRYATAVEHDLDKALALLDTPAAAASKDTNVMYWRAFQLGSVGRTDEALAVHKQLAEFDPGYRQNFVTWRNVFVFLRRPADAIRVVRAFNEHGTPVISLAELEFAFTGNTQGLREEFERTGDQISGDPRLAAAFNLLRIERRFTELRDLFALQSATALHSSGFRDNVLRDTYSPGMGNRPLAELRGWTTLLTGDKQAAAREGQLILDFVAREPVTKWNDWYLRFLAAEGALLSGNKTRAIADTRAAMAMSPSSVAPTPRIYISTLATRIFAWAGAEDEAVALLEQLATKYPAIGPAEITRDPLYSLPLANNARYKALERKLEAEIEANRTLFALSH